MNCPFQSLGKTSHETPYCLITTYKYIREYWLTKNTFFGYYLSCPCNSESYRTFFGKILQKGHQNNYWKSCAKLFFFLSDCDGK